jgi:hypothetical protein
VPPNTLRYIYCIFYSCMLRCRRAFRHVRLSLHHRYHIYREVWALRMIHEVYHERIRDEKYAFSIKSVGGCDNFYSTLIFSMTKEVSLFEYKENVQQFHLRLQRGVGYYSEFLNMKPRGYSISQICKSNQIKSL